MHRIFLLSVLVSFQRLQGWDVTLHVTVDPKRGKSEKMVVPMEIGK